MVPNLVAFDSYDSSYVAFFKYSLDDYRFMSNLYSPEKPLPYEGTLNRQLPSSPGYHVDPGLSRIWNIKTY